MTRIITHFVVTLLCCFFFSVRTMSQPVQMLTYCGLLSDNLTRTSSYGSSRDTILSTLRNHSSLGSYYNATTGLTPNKVHGMFLCRGDINTTSCSNCVHTATLELATTCNSHKKAIIFYEECIARFSNSSFFTLVEDVPAISSCSPINRSEPFPFFNQTLPGEIDKLILRAPSSSLQVPYFVEDQKRVTQVEGSYELEAMVQCSPDLDPNNCTSCLNLAARFIFHCYSHARFAQTIFPKCLIRYNISALQPNIASPAAGFTKGKEIFGRMFTAVVVALVLALMGL